MTDLSAFTRSTLYVEVMSVCNLRVRPVMMYLLLSVYFYFFFHTFGLGFLFLFWLSQGRRMERRHWMIPSLD